MGAALSIFVLLSISIFVTRIAAVALRFTGLAESAARFQALSAFTGTGFTTSEAETVVNYPVRRRIVSMLMVIGNMGLVTVFAALVVSLVRTDGEFDAVIEQLLWLLGGMGLLWFLMLNKTADRLMCALIGRFLESTTFLGKRNFHRLLQLGNGYSVCEHPANSKWHGNKAENLEAEFEKFGLRSLAVRTANGQLLVGGHTQYTICDNDALVLFGADPGHERIAVSTSHDSDESGTDSETNKGE